VLRQESLTRQLTLPPDLPDDALVDVTDEWMVRAPRRQTGLKTPRPAAFGV
jgi:hypothetical protein